MLASDPPEGAVSSPQLSPAHVRRRGRVRAVRKGAAPLSARGVRAKKRHVRELPCAHIEPTAERGNPRLVALRDRPYRLSAGPLRTSEGSLLWVLPREQSPTDEVHSPEHFSTGNSLCQPKRAGLATRCARAKKGRAPARQQPSALAAVRLTQGGLADGVARQLCQPMTASCSVSDGDARVFAVDSLIVGRSDRRHWHLLAPTVHRRGPQPAALGSVR